MSDVIAKHINELPDGLPVDGTEQIPVWQNNVTRKITIEDASVVKSVNGKKGNVTVYIEDIPTLKGILDNFARYGGLSYKGVWNAYVGTPTLPIAAYSSGSYYKVNVAGNFRVNGIGDWDVGDWIISNGTTWDKIDNSEIIASINGQIGTVVLDYADVGAEPIGAVAAHNALTTTAHGGLHTHSNKGVLDGVINTGTGTHFLSDDGGYKEVVLSPAPALIAFSPEEGLIPNKFIIRLYFNTDMDASTINSTNIIFRRKL